MISIKSKHEMDQMRIAGQKLGAIFDKLALEVRPGRSTWEINHIAEELIRQSGGTPHFAMEEG